MREGFEFPLDRDRGASVLQFFDKVDPTGASYDELGRRIEFGQRKIRYSTGYGAPAYKAAEKTFGPKGNWLCWPYDESTPRKVAHWANVFPTVQTSALTPPLPPPPPTGATASKSTPTTASLSLALAGTLDVVKPIKMYADGVEPTGLPFPTPIGGAVADNTLFGL